MIEVLQEIERILPERLVSREGFKSMYIDYHPPIVERIWFPYKEYRVYLHKIHPCNESKLTLFHPHPWKSAVKIINGKYEMGVGHSKTDEVPAIDCKLVLTKGSTYEMTAENGWHYVNPIDRPVYSLMVTGELFKRKMPVEPKKNFRELTEQEINNILLFFNISYLDF